MKKIFLFLAGTIIVICISCNKKADSNTEANNLAPIENQQLADMNESELFLDAINISMDSMINMEGIILRTSNEHPISNKERIKQNLETYKLILKQQHERINLLESKLKSNNTPLTKKMRHTIAALKQQLNEKNAAIVELTEELTRRNFDIQNLKQHVVRLNTNVEELKKINKNQEEALITQSDMMNDGYVIIGNKNKLKAAGVLVSGSILKKSKLDMSKMNISAFEKIDIRKITSFTIPGKNVEILSQAPKNSYQINNNDNGTSTLVIVSPSDFWSISKYLVIKYK